MGERDFPRRFGKYILLDRINSGGMAEVFLAKLSGVAKFERLIAIKCIKPDLAKDEHFAAMFIDEANLAGQLSHANIAQIYELGRYKEQLYIAMELVQGRDLRHIGRRVKNLVQTLPLGFVAYVVAKAAEGLDYAHRKTGQDGAPLKLVHRDVSPQNVLVSYEGEVKVVDFGIAKANQRSSDTHVGVLKGKFSYMAPEQIRNEEIDRRADIFTLGAVLYELVSQQKLFDGKSDMEVLDKVRRVTLPDFRAALPEAPPELISVLSTALSPKPEQRFQYASEMAKALEPLLIKPDRSIFGSIEASAYMRELYADEIDSHANRRYEDVRDEDLSGPSKPKGEVFRSSFEADADPASLAHAPTVAISLADIKALRRRSERPKLRIPTEEREPPAKEEQAAAERESAVRELPWRRYLLPGLAGGAGGLALIVGVTLAVSGRDAPRSPEPKPAAAAAPPAIERSERDFGFLTVKVTGAKAAKVFVDGKEIGRAPVLAHRLRAGIHTVKVVELRRGRPDRSRTRKVLVEPTSTREQPALVVVDI